MWFRELAGDSAASGGCGGRVGAPGCGRGCAACTISYAFDAAPQMARIHPMGREVLRVLVSLHRRANPELKRLFRLSGIHL
ncbi:hypothetical protein GCM10015535_69150 [Streptomyces gelaticus]|uniref:Radical SAM protein n=1 Tax=Streptomyces gelaticus TaxID=285446 RepID=A0ABQ2WA12_9ACTN|nr:hypothetical protein GCM10015535_69150 [Streptomyces gelaticus]